MVAGPKVEILERDMIIHSLAVATNNSVGFEASNILQSKEILVDNDAVFKLDQYGIKPQQYIEQDFKFTDTGFANVKNKKRSVGQSNVSNSKTPSTNDQPSIDTNEEERQENSTQRAKELINEKSQDETMKLSQREEKSTQSQRSGQDSLEIQNSQISQKETANQICKRKLDSFLFDSHELNLKFKRQKK